MMSSARMGFVLMLLGLCFLGAGQALAQSTPDRAQLEAAHQYLKEVLAPEINCIVEHLPAMARANPAYPAKLRDEVRALQACRQDAEKPTLDRDSAALKNRLDSLMAELTNNGARLADLHEKINRLESEKSANPTQATQIQEKIDSARNDADKLSAQFGAQEAKGGKLEAEFRALAKKVTQRLNEMAKP